MYRLKALQAVAQRAMMVTSCVDVAAANCAQNAFRFGATVTERHFRTTVNSQVDTFTLMLKGELEVLHC